MAIADGRFDLLLALLRRAFLLASADGGEGVCFPPFLSALSLFPPAGTLGGGRGKLFYTYSLLLCSMRS
jgi:hypothetical protein